MLGSEQDESADNQRRSGLIPLVLVVVALIGSVAIPARQTWLITGLLRKTTQILSPARLHQAELQSGLAQEIGALQRYALFGDTADLTRYRVMARRDDALVAQLETLAAQLSAPAAAHVATIRRRIDAWRRASGSPIARNASRAAVAAAVETGQLHYDDCLVAIAQLSADFGNEASARADRVRSLERFSLMSNIALVLAAFGALASVIVLSARERRLAALLRTRVDEESARARREVALRESAEALAGVFTADDVTQRIARAALDVVDARGAFIEWVTRDAGVAERLVVRAVAGTGAPALSSSCEFAGSLTESATRSGNPELISNFGLGESDARSTFVAGPAAAIVVPLGSPGAMLGALYILSARDSFRPEDVARAAILGHLAALAYEKVRLFDQEIEGRQRLERVSSSRSRLMRGFSHDVKNPIGAADGYAELLGGGIYGDLNAAQRESIARLRRCIHDALGLIDDLHELARAETGHLALSMDVVDLPDLLRDVGEEYQARARSRRLTLTVDVGDDSPLIRTSRTRVRQILANLLSNAIKYTEHGSVSVGAARRLSGPSGADGEWVRIDVADTGRGIPADKLDFIFEEFGRVGDSDQTGAGLGLAISRLIAQALGGQITVTSEPGLGSTFMLWLPVVSSAVDAVVLPQWVRSRDTVALAESMVRTSGAMVQADHL